MSYKKYVIGPNGDIMDVTAFEPDNKKDGSMDREEVLAELSESISNVIASLEDIKPGDRSEEDREFAIIITEFQKAKALLDHWLR